MKKTKSIFLSAMITVAVTCVIIISSCTKSDDTYTPPNPCASVTCFNGGTCSNGVCTCAYGYTGTYCQTEIPKKGYLRIDNNSSNPYNVYVNGVLQGTLEGGYYYLLSESPGTYTVRVIQQSGYISYPTDETFTKTVTSLGVTEISFP